MFFFFFFDEKSLYENTIVRKAFDIVLIRKLKSDKYCDLREFIYGDTRNKNEVKDMLAKMDSPFVKLFEEKYPDIEGAMHKWNDVHRALDSNDDEYIMTKREAWAIVYWIYRCYKNIEQRKAATISALNEIYNLFHVEELDFRGTFIFLKNEVEINIINSVTGYCDEIKNMEKEECSIFFRGHSDTEYLLLPSIMRRSGWYEHERDIYNEIIIDCPEEFNDCTSHLEHLVHMQHYGVPTRLLDITKNPLVALYFACESQEDKNGEIIVFSIPKKDIKYAKSDAVSVLASLAAFTSDDKKFILECANSNDNEENFNKKIKRLVHEVRMEKPAFVSKIDKKDITSAFFVLPEKRNKRIIKQDGAFIICGLINEDDNIINEYKYKDNDKIQIYIIENKEKKQILKQLDKLSINKASLFPEIEEVAEYIKQKY